VVVNVKKKGKQRSGSLVGLITRCILNRVVRDSSLKRCEINLRSIA
jgi:hypothetical protein